MNSLLILYITITGISVNRVFSNAACNSAIDGCQTYTINNAMNNLTCFPGCNCDTSTATCTTLPVCMYAVLLKSSTIGSNIDTIPSDMLNSECMEHNYDSLIIKSNPLLHTIQANFTSPQQRNLTDIQISYNNKLRVFDNQSFADNFTQLLHLTISNNAVLDNLQFLVKVEMRFLEKLDLGYNAIRLLPCGLFDNMFNLKWLVLNGNQLWFIDECYLGPLPLRSPGLRLQLENNPLQCNCSMNSMFNGDTAYYLSPLDNETKCDMGEDFPAIDIYTIITLHNCSAWTHEELKNMSGCDCYEEPPVEICAPDCILFKNHPPCSKNHTMDGFWEKHEGCICEDIIDFLDSHFGSQWKAKYCHERGIMSAHLKQQSWRYWLSIVGFVILVILIPFGRWVNNTYKDNLKRKVKKTGVEEEDNSDSSSEED